MKKHTNNQSEDSREIKSAGSFDSVEGMLDALGHKGIADEIRRDETESLAHQLALLRKKSGKTQIEFAQSIGCAQSSISAFEASENADISLGMVANYARILEKRIFLNVGKPMSHAESVRFHFAQLSHHLSMLADIAKKTPDGESLREGIRAFQSEATDNLLRLAFKTSPNTQRKQEKKSEPEVVSVQMVFTPEEAITR